MNKIEEIERQIFYIEMADHLEDSDYKLLDELNRKLKEVRGEKI